MRIRPIQLVPAVPLAILVAMYVSGAVVDVDGRGTSAVARGASSVFLIGPAVGAWCAWRASMLRRGAVSELAPSRGAPRVVMDQARVPLLAGCTSLVGAVILALLLAQPIRGWPDFRVVLTTTVVVMGHAALGYRLGSLAPAVVAIPLIFLSLYLWMVFPQAYEPVWVRHLNGFSATCCGLWADFDGEALVAPILVAVGVPASAWLTGVVGWRLLPRIGVPAAVLLASLVSASLLVAHLGPDPIQPRDPDDLKCLPGSPVVCTWPENAHRAREVQVKAQGIGRALADADIRVPDRVTEAVPGTTADDWHIGMRPTTEPELLHGMIVAGLVPARPECFRPGHDGSAVLVAWLLTKTGLERDAVAVGLSRWEATDLEALLGSPEASQTRWYEETRGALDRCARVDGPGPDAAPFHP